jgi:predicted Rossmann fold flavoprotein
VIVLERNDAFGKKIRISGGGRCKFTNVHTAPEDFISGNPHFHKSALAGYTPSDFIELVERHRIRYHEKKLGQLFCDGTSDEILNLLRKEAEKAKVEVRTNCAVTSIRKKGGFLIETKKESLACKSLVIATGGLSIPRLGATGFGHSIAKQFGLRVTELRPGLVPLLAGPWPDLSGVSLDASVSLRDATFHEKILFTHRGLSGPAILQISSY